MQPDGTYLSGGLAGGIRLGIHPVTDRTTVVDCRKGKKEGQKKFSLSHLLCLGFIIAQKLVL